ncbi:hypothetical protein OAA76_05785 [Planktotalea frisia]|jgi:hypothetical protein|nr:hypothetical protein [Planktotalea frisia]
MVQVIATTLPKSACLNDYEHHAGVYTDCFQTELPKGGTLESYINAFFNTWLFRIERMILSTAAKKPVSDEDIARLAQGTSNTMSAWQVERRDADQILLEVPQTPIRTWLMRSGEGEKTQLYFGSAILPDAVDRNGNAKMPFLFHALLGFHKLYARALLFSAKRALR